MIRIPLRNRRGGVRAFALVDDRDAYLAEGCRWHLSTRGYVVRNARRDGRPVTLLLHRAVLGLDSSDPREVDHRSGQPLDCRRRNLRIVTHAANCQNITRRHGRSRFRNVSWYARRGCWQVRLSVAGRQVHRGYFADEIEAAIAAKAARDELMPFAEPDRELERVLRRLAVVA